MFTTRFISRIGATRLVTALQKRVTYSTPWPLRTMATGGGTGHLNRLATAKSPYLRQHATNPVDWYPFEKAALDKAKADNKVKSLLNELTTWQVIFLSIGYSACHWSFPHLESQLTPGAMYSIPLPLLTAGNGTRILRE